MNYLKFQKQILAMTSNEKKMSNFEWDYEEGYYYITLDRCSIYRVPAVNMLLNLGMIKPCYGKMASFFNDMSKNAINDLTIKDNITTDHFSMSFPMVNMFEEEELWYKLEYIETIGKWDEIVECVHFRCSDRGGLIAFNEADEPIALVLPVKVKEKK